MKIKPFSGQKRCKETGEVYTFRKGVAEVPGMMIGGKPATITIHEFLRGNK
jgi:hypothetical protein